MKIHFYLRYTTRFGQMIRLSTDQAATPEIALSYVNDELWRGTIEVAPNTCIKYRYTVAQQGAMDLHQHGQLEVTAPAKGVAEMTVIDTWNGMEAIENVYFTQAFEKLLRGKERPVKAAQPKTVTHVFSIKVPVLQQHQVPVMLGSGNALHDWSTHQPIHMQRTGNEWTAHVDLSETEFPITYKYALHNTLTGSIDQFEDGANRTLYFGAAAQQQIAVRDGFIRLAVPAWRGSGVAIPVFSLRTEQSFGCGSFTDMHKLADWAASVGMKVIQLLPINDTAATGTWTDSYPYASISAFALNPIYADPMAVAGTKHAALVKASYKKHQAALAALDVVDYEVTLREKWAMLTALYEEMGAETLATSDYKTWFEAQRSWLEPYAVFCTLKDQYGTNDFNQWPQHSAYNQAEIAKLTAPSSKAYKTIALHYFVQYQLHTQLKAATDYANSKGLVVKGDIPIGIYRYSCDAWVAPELYNMDMQAGAPPDPFSATGQNWGFPTYRWDKMKQDGYAWWASRFNQMSLYFDAFRIDHILGFFRIWSIPLHAVEGILGHFEPAIPVQLGELLESGVRFDQDRFCAPYINTQIVNQVFGLEAIQAVAIFMDRTEMGGYRIKPRYQTQRQVETWYEESEKSKTAAMLRDGMYQIIANVLLFPVQGGQGPAYHFRYGIEQTSSFQYLDLHSQNALRRLYNNYFFERQDAFWEREAMEKLPALKQATEMLICGEDLGMVPHCVPDVMRSLALLSLEIQRMPKATTTEFFNPADAPYLSVVTPSTHDMSTIRGWWEEDRAVTGRFHATTFGGGDTPFFCEPWVNRSIVEQHLMSPAMWAIFQLQDLMGIDGTLRRQDPADERINLPSNPKHYWRYRMHMTLESLMKEQGFNTLLSNLIEGAGR